MNVDHLKARVEALLVRANQAVTGGAAAELGTELLQGTITIMQGLYGPDSPQETTLREIMSERRGMKATPAYYMGQLVRVATGALMSIKGELDAGLVGNLQRQIAGDVLIDFVRLARHVLEEQGEAGKDVAAVLVAAAYEDTLRRMAAIYTTAPDDEQLERVIDALKAASVLVPPQLSATKGYLNFRNHAMHAKWKEIDLTTVKSALGLVEELVLKHFA